MGCTTTSVGYIPGGPKTMLKSGPTVSWTAHELPPARSHKPVVPDLSTVTDRRLRQTKSYTLPHKNRKTVTDSISRSYSVATNFSAEKGATTSLSPWGLSNRDLKLVCFLMGRYMRCEVCSASRCSRWTALQARFWSRLLPRSRIVSSCIS